jgi:LemA protein
MAFERGVLEEVARQRAAYAPTDPVPVQGAVSVATTSAIRSMFAVVERYPELRSQQNVLELQASIERLEQLLADRRELYNDQVYRFNTRIGQFPANLAARLFDWRARPFFAAGAASRVAPPVELG